MDILETQHLLERVASLLRTETRNLLLVHGLQPVQFEALHYLSICNRYSDTPMGVTEYLGQTKGSVSQTLKVLEKKGLIEKTADKSDKRVAHLSVTKAGRNLVSSMLPSPSLARAGKQLGRTDEASIDASLRNLLRSMQQANNFKTFGQCATCRHNIRLTDDEYVCGLTEEALSGEDIELICREHKPNQSSEHGAVTGAPA
ncbi:MarR family winged helix-turn-helix transcriptional regulator [Pseudohalioglobus lutimaris]|uniref:MarR family transcriptional regulator n=1 Tax=Pseudohalioglobus lutimaris TaxID=1737061 RepID=A0A2N5WXX5_9GAMM|nr:MarR family winged helix-turn-helix transcriptional regulator [Pseudohalioglobus lutimaris]PLW67089.1 MarR family transcriptional regulator [Pseudohalioglobus lutimaris]